MLSEKLKNYRIILASKSPRRQDALKHLGLDFEVRLNPIKEVYPDYLKHSEISNYLSKLKATPFIKDLNPIDLLITSDTIVWHNNQALGKPKDKNDAYNMLKSLSGSTHEVITSITFTMQKWTKTVHDITKVIFKPLSDDEIYYYINRYQPFDKAGSYGIQEWIGQIAITHIEGSFFNVVGLPTHLLYNTLMELP